MDRAGPGARKRGAVLLDCQALPRPGPMSKKRQRIQRRELTPQSPEQQRRGGPSAAQQTVPKAGIVTEIQLKNFMNHGSFEWRPKPRVNVVHGENGAGKSSVLQGLVLGLGGRGSDTKRYSSVGDFVRRGASRADIRITLSNVGEDAYRPAAFGDAIVVERSITAAGASAYRLKNSRHEVVADGKKATAERDRMLDLFRIEVNNPLTILQQEEAKKFFHAESPAHIYNFFERTTMLEKCSTEYHKASTEIQVTKEELYGLETQLAEKKDVEQTWEEKWHERQRLTRHEENDKNNKKQLKWGAAEKCESQMKAKRMDLEEAGEAEDGDAEERIKKHHRLGELKKKENARDEQNAEIQRRIEEVQLEANNMKEEMDKSVSDYKESCQQLERLKAKKIEANKESLIIDRHIQNTERANNNRDDVDQEDVAERQQKEMNNVETRIQEITEQQERLGVDRDKIIAEKEEIAKLEKEMNMERNAKDSEIRRISKTIETESNKNHSDLTRYGMEMERFCTEVQTAKTNRLFKKAPIGPIGSHIHLRAGIDADRSLLIEAELGAVFLKQFLVDNKDDERALRQIMDRVFHRKPPNIVIQRNTGRKHDIANGRVPRSQEHPALLDFLQIDNPEVFNTVIDWKSAETTLVISHGEAMRIFKERGTVPSNASKAITVQEGSGHFYRFFPPTRGNYSSYSMEKPRGQNRVLVADKQEHVRELQAEREDALRTLNDLKADEDNLKEKRMTLENRRQKNLKKKEFYNSEISQLRQQKTQIKHLLDESAKCKILVSDLKEQQAEKDREKKELDQQISAVFRKNGQIGRAKKELEQRHKNKVNEVEALDDTLQGQQGDEDISREIKTLRAQITQLERKHEQKATKRAKLEWEYKEAKDRFETAENSALEYCNGERLSVTKTAQQIRAEIAEYKKMDEDLKKKVGATAAEIMRNKIEAKSSREALENKIAQINHQVLQLTFMKNKRKEGFKIIRNRLGRALKREFAMLMAKHANLLGTLDVNTEHKVLNISVGRTEDNPTDLNVEQNKIPLSSLSGGERSKTLSCFILALWSKQLSPFRALDEWDVFLDDQARTELGNLFIEFGKATDSQYFILSPQTMAITEEMEEGKDEVRKMHKSASASASADN